MDKDKIKQNLLIEQVYQLVTDLGGNPIMHNGYFISQTICHNPPHEGSYKLYYYDNTKLFKCFTHCDDTFDIFELIMKIKSLDLYQAILYIINYFNLSTVISNFDDTLILNQDWKILQKYFNHLNKINKQIVNIKTFDEKILHNLPQVRILPWEQEGIKPEIIKKRGILYDPKNEGIVIPHYNINGELIGIRERTLIKEEEEKGKYKPAVFNGQMYNHPLSFNLYNLNNSKDNIKMMRMAVIVEGEKSCLKYASYFGEDHDISVAVCGSSLIGYQVQLLLSLGVQEIIIAFDKQFKELNDEEHKKWCKKLTNIYEKYGSLVQISYLFDKQNLLKYKDSPLDEGKKIFLQLFKERIFL